MKKLLITFSFVLLVVLGIYANHFFSFAASTTEFCLTSNSNENVEIGDKVKMQVCVNSDNIDGFQGTIMYDKDLVLTEITPSKEFSSKAPIYDYGPSLDLSGEAISKTDSSKKIIGFDGTLNEDDINEDNKAFSGEMTILNLTFDTSDCEEGKTYNVSWDTSESKLVGAKTCAFKDDSKQQITTKPLAITMVGANNKDPNKAPITGGDENLNKDDKAPITGGNEDSNKDDKAPITGGDKDSNKDDKAPITGGDEDSNKDDKAPITGGDKDSNKDDKAPITGGNEDSNKDDKKPITDGDKDLSNKDTTVKDENIDKMPQTGGNLLTYTIILLAIVEVFVFVSYKKMKKYSGI